MYRHHKYNLLIPVIDKDTAEDFVGPFATPLSFPV